MSAGPIRLPAALLSTEWLSGFTAEFRGRLPVPKVINLVPKLGPNFIGISGQAGSCGRSTSGRHTVGTSPVFPDRDAESAESQVVYPFQQWKALTIPASETVPPEGVKDPTTADTRKSYFVETLLHESHLRYWANVPDEEIMGHSRHRSLATMRSYVRRSKLSHASPAGKVGL